MDRENESENFQKIQDTALHLFAQRGYDAVGIQEICNASSITKPTLYYYFKSKQGLLSSIIQTRGAELVSITDKALLYEHDFIKSLTLVLKETADFAHQNEEYFRLHLNLLSSPKDSESFASYEETSLHLAKTYRDFFVFSSAEFGNMRDKEELYSLLYQSLVNQSVLAMLTGKIKMDDGTVYRIIHSFVYGVAS